MRLGIREFRVYYRYDTGRTHYFSKTFFLMISFPWFPVFTYLQNFHKLIRFLPSSSIKNTLTADEW